ncbi:sorting nexin-31 [Neopsephotus bourkii]|uniref:sorting nexin-31 n=1 Tax=Neopsephotus bourkii TaxID=309878 RepID=UPI002AA55E6A|nr:sorting nexin-31 [Neopsephotus bourkii]
MDTFKIQTQRAFLDVYLADGSNIRLEIQTSDTAERILEALLLSSCLKKMVLEQMIKAAKEGQETEMKMPESMINSKKSSIQQKQVVHLGFIG